MTGDGRSPSPSPAEGEGRRRISFTDAFAVATARVEDGAVITSDPEILALPRDVVRVVKLVR